MAMSRANVSQITDAVVVIVICFGWPIVGSLRAFAYAYPAQPFDDSIFLTVILEELILATVALVYLRWRGHDLSLLVPRPTLLGGLVGLGLYALATLVIWPVYALAGAEILSREPIEQMVAGSSISTFWLVAVSIVNALFEETFLTGYVLRELIAFAAPLAISVTVLIRALAHVYQGPLGTFSVICVGIVLATYYWRKRQLWPVVFAHFVADFAGFALR
jgi:membrane protease YdiL (CAAX protease family)